MTTLKQNIIANLLGKIGSMVLGLAFVPVYINILGPESYGLIGFYATLQAVFLLADLGLGQTFARETASKSAEDGRRNDLWDLFRSFEWVFLIMGGVTAVIIGVMSEYLAVHWVQGENVSTLSVHRAIMLMGGIIGLQFLNLFYQSGLMGLQRHVSLNVLLVGSALARGVGTAAIITLYSPRIEAFFTCQLIVSAGQILVGRSCVKRALPISSYGGSFQFSVVSRLWKFALGMAAISLTSVLLMQVDKIILSKMLTLEQFGFYSLAVSIAGIPMLLGTPLSNAIYPRLTQLVATNALSTLVELYHRSCQLLACLLLPTGCVLILFPRELVFAWIGNPTVADSCYQFVRVLGAGSTLLSMMLLPYVLQLAYGWTRLMLAFNAIAIVVLAPLLIYLTHYFGAIGACFSWLLLNVAYVTTFIPLMHRRILVGEQARWYFNDLTKPLLGAIVPLGILLPFVSKLSDRSTIVIVLGIAWFLSILCATLSSANLRSYIPAIAARFRLAGYRSFRARRA